MSEPGFTISHDEMEEADRMYVKKIDRALTRWWGCVGLLLICILLSIFFPKLNDILASIAVFVAFTFGYQQRAVHELRAKRKALQGALTGKVARP